MQHRIQIRSDGAEYKIRVYVSDEDNQTVTIFPPSRVCGTDVLTGLSKANATWRINSEAKIRMGDLFSKLPSLQRVGQRSEMDSSFF